jgi:hypothetical protein
MLILFTNYIFVNSTRSPFRNRDIFWAHKTSLLSSVAIRCPHGPYRLAVWFTTTCGISAYNHKSCAFEPRSWRGVLDATLGDKVCQWPTTGRRFFPSTRVSSTNKTNRHDIAEILLNTIAFSPTLVAFANEVRFSTHRYKDHNISDIDS